MKKAYRKILCLILSAVMIIGIMPMAELKTDAVSQVYTSEDGQWLYTKQTDDKLSSRGKFNNYCARLVRYLGNDINVSIPDKIDGLEVFIIGEKCFYGDIIDTDDVADINALDAIKSITIGPDIYDIEDQAFAYMDSLEEVVFYEERPAYYDGLRLGSQLFKESIKLESFIMPEIKECRPECTDTFCCSNIKYMTVPGYYLTDYYCLSDALEYLTVTGDFRVSDDSNSAFNKLFITQGLKEVIFEGCVESPGSEANYYGPGRYDKEYYPDFIFYHTPTLYLEQKLENSGYIRNYDYETSTVSFSFNNTPDTKYIPVTDALVSENFEYSLTAEGNAIILDYFGCEENLVFPDVIDGHSVIGIGEEKEDKARLSEIRERSILSVTIPEGVEYIGKRAFYKWQFLEDVDFPESLRIIDGEAFARCYALKDIILPDIIYLGYRAFAYCEHNRISIPGTLKEIPMYAFEVKSNGAPVEEITIAEGVESIGACAFISRHAYKDIKDCFSLTLPSTLKYIGEDAFHRLNLCGDIIIPNGVETIYGGTFFSNYFLNSITLPEGLKYICEDSFEDCVLQSPLVIPDSVLRIDQCAFLGLTAPTVAFPLGTKIIPLGCFDGGKLDYLYLPDGINILIADAFTNCEIGELTIPNSVSDFFVPSTHTKINKLTFGSCSKQGDKIFNSAEIGELTFTGDNAYIQANAFYKCSINKMTITGETYFDKSAFKDSTIKQLEISEYVSNLNSSFYGCSGFEKIIFAAKRCTNARGLLENINNNTEFVLGDGIEYIPEGLFQGYKFADKFEIPQTVTHIFDDAFASTNITEITLPPNLEYIGKSAFADCAGIETVTIPKTVITIGAGAFSGCSALENVILLCDNCYVDSYDKGVFDNCPNLREFIFGDEIKYIPDYLLNGTGIESITIPDSVTDIGSYSFANTNLKNIVLPDSIESMGDGCFENCKELETAVINSNIMLIGDNTFRGCDKLREIYIADSVMDIGRTSFSGCTSLETVYMSKNVVYIPERCFENCTALSSFTWESDSKLIGKLAFSGCTSLTVFDFTGIAKLYPNSFQGSGIGVASLGEARNEAAAALQVVEAQSFMSCPELQTVALGGNVSTVQTKAFANCENLETAIISDSVETIAPDAFENCPKLTIYCSESSYAYNYATSNDIKVSTFVVEPIPNQKYTGRVIEPEVKVSLSGNPLARNEDFRVRYTDNVNVGTAAAKVSGINDYKMFTSTVNFAIISRNISEAEIGSIADQSYKGGEVTPKVKVTYNGKTLREGTDYNVIYTSNDSAGTAKATIIGTGNYSGTHTVTFNIVESPAGDNPADEPGNNPEENTSFIRTVLNFFMRIIAAFRNLFAGFFTV